jgi:hypothetical protein
VISRTLTLLVLLLLLICLIADARASPPANAQEILSEMKTGFESFDGAYVEYEVYTVTDDKEFPWLSMQEALSDKIYYCRVVHWYYRAMYLIDAAHLDPLLNSYYWSNNGRVAIQEAKGMVNLSKGNRRYIAEPEIGQYFGHIGLLTPERVTQPSPGIEGSDAEVVGYNARDYYMCTAISKPEEWELVNFDVKSNHATIQRHIKDSVESITVDRTFRSSIVRRIISHAPSKAKYTIACDDFVQLLPTFWLPQELTVTDTGKGTQIYRVTKILHDIPEIAVKPDSAQPGFRVHNEDGTETIIPGGEELLDAAIERMKLAKTTEEYRNWTSAFVWMAGLAAQIVLYFLLRRLMTARRGNELAQAQLSE